MINAIYGTKVGMTQLFDEDGTVIPVTVIEAAPNTVCQIAHRGLNSVTFDHEKYDTIEP